MSGNSTCSDLKAFINQCLHIIARVSDHRRLQGVLNADNRPLEKRHVVLNEAQSSDLLSVSKNDLREFKESVGYYEKGGNERSKHKGEKIVLDTAQNESIVYGNLDSCDYNTTKTFDGLVDIDSSFSNKKKNCSENLKTYNQSCAERFEHINKGEISQDADRMECANQRLENNDAFQIIPEKTGDMFSILEQINIKKYGHAENDENSFSLDNGKHRNKKLRSPKKGNSDSLSVGKGGKAVSDGVTKIKDRDRSYETNEAITNYISLSADKTFEESFNMDSRSHKKKKKHLKSLEIFGEEIATKNAVQSIAKVRKDLISQDINFLEIEEQKQKNAAVLQINQENTSSNYKENEYLEQASLKRSFEQVLLNEKLKRSPKVDNFSENSLSWINSSKETSGLLHSAETASNMSNDFVTKRKKKSKKLDTSYGTNETHSQTTSCLDPENCDSDKTLCGDLSFEKKKKKRLKNIETSDEKVRSKEVCLDQTDNNVNCIESKKKNRKQKLETSATVKSIQEEEILKESIEELECSYEYEKRKKSSNKRKHMFTDDKYSENCLDNTNSTEKSLINFDENVNENTSACNSKRKKKSKNKHKVSEENYGETTNLAVADSTNEMVVDIDFGVKKKKRKRTKDLEIAAECNDYYQDLAEISNCVSSTPKTKRKHKREYENLDSPQISQNNEEGRSDLNHTKKKLKNLNKEENTTCLISTDKHLNEEHKKSKRRLISLKNRMLDHWEKCTNSSPGNDHLMNGDKNDIDFFNKDNCSYKNNDTIKTKDKHGEITLETQPANCSNCISKTNEGTIDSNLGRKKEKKKKKKHKENVETSDINVSFEEYLENTVERDQERISDNVNHIHKKKKKHKTKDKNYATVDIILEDVNNDNYQQDLKHVKKKSKFSANNENAASSLAETDSNLRYMNSLPWDDILEVHEEWISSSSSNHELSRSSDICHSNQKKKTHKSPTFNEILECPSKSKRKKHKENENEGNLKVSNSLINASAYISTEIPVQDIYVSCNTPAEEKNRRKSKDAAKIPMREVTDESNFLEKGNLYIEDDIDSIAGEELKFDNDQEILERLNKCDDNYCLTEDVAQKIKDIHIVVDWDVPVLHTIETRLSTVPTKDQLSLIEFLNLEVKKGPFNKEEDEQILANFRDFCRRHDLPPDPMPFLKINTGSGRLLVQSQRILFGQCLARGLNTRLLHTVYRHFQHITVTKKRTGRRFAPKEDKFILENVKRFKHPFRDIGKILSRCSQSVAKRYDILTEGKYAYSWDLDTCEKLLKHLMELKLVVEVDELKQRDIYDKEWKIIAKDMNIHAMRLKAIWYHKLYPHLFIPDHLDRKTVIYKVFERLRDLKVEEWDDINWKVMAEAFEGWNEVHLKSLIIRMKTYIPSGLQNSVAECANYCLRHLPRISFKTVPKLIYENGHLRKEERKKKI